MSDSRKGKKKCSLRQKKAHTGYSDLCPGAKWPERELTTHPYPVQRLEVNGAIPPLSCIPSWQALGQM